MIISDPTHRRFVVHLLSSLDFLRCPIRYLGNSLRLATDLAPTVLPLHPACDAHILVPEEPPEHEHPAVVARQRGVELVRDLPQLGQLGPCHSGEVVVLIVVAHVVREHIERAVVAESLWHWDVVVGVLGLWGDSLVDVVLRDEVTGGWVPRTGQERAEQQVQDRFVAVQGHDHDVVECKLHDEVEKMDPGEGDLENTHGPDGVEEDLEGAEECLAQDGVEDHSLEGGGEVGIQPVHAQALMVRQVVGPETRAVGQPDGQVGEDGEHPVCQW